MEEIFKKIDEKLKSAAKFTLVVNGVIALLILIGGLVVGHGNLTLYAFVIAIVYFSASLATCYILYGFAELITYTKQIRDNLSGNEVDVPDELPEL